MILLKTPLFLVRLLVLLLATLTSFLRLKLNKYTTIIILYLFLFIQAILILNNHSPIISDEKKDPPGHQVTTAENINLERLISGQYEVIKTSTKNLNASLVRINELLEKQPSHRDLLINKALLESALNQEQDSKKSYLKAKRLDPNWAGFKE
ncbi:MAG: hypothetical protein U9O78_01670 [Patescibacteria group bacterium]|nr:hypothetical protein [Patescibacteria group bacterium]